MPAKDRTAEIATVLRTSEKNALVRASKLRLLPPCGRCGGSGSHSFNQMHGSRCYGCGGCGQVKPKTAGEWTAAVEAATAAAADGRLDTYLARLDAERRAKNGAEKIFAAWTRLSIANKSHKVHWTQKPEAASADNHVVSPMLDAFNKAAARADWPEADRLLAETLAEIERRIATYPAASSDVP